MREELKVSLQQGEIKGVQLGRTPSGSGEGSSHDLEGLPVSRSLKASRRAPERVSGKSDHSHATPPDHVRVLRLLSRPVVSLSQQVSLASRHGSRCMIAMIRYRC